MILGLSSPLNHNSPQEWAERMVSIEAKAIVFPVDSNSDSEVIKAYKEAADKNGLLIAEVGVWRNTLAKEPEERKANIEYAVNQLKMADEIGANCCVNVLGTPYGPRWDGGYKGNFSEENWNQAVLMIQKVIDRAKPKKTKYTIEPMPWMIPTSPDEYLKLIKDVNRKEFGVHLDIVNMINTPQRYFFNQDFIKECFEKLKGKICSCHIKDINLKEEFTFQLEEVACGQGNLDLELYAELATKENPKMPMIIEHLHSDEEYLASLEYLKKRLAK